MNNETPTAKPATDADGTISAVNMAVALAMSGVPLKYIKLYDEMSDTDKAQVRAALA